MEGAEIHMKPISINRFSEYFRALHERDPYDWQVRLAKQAVEGTWPGAMCLPTGSGKTSCLDIAVFALACQSQLKVEDRRAPRRVFFCVNRRVIVDEAHQRAIGIARKLWSAERESKDSILRDVASSLRSVAGTSEKDAFPPLDVLELRGGIYRDNRWSRSATQPTIICTTVDQLGSRLLFRGYGVSDGARPIQASMIAFDSLILLDEAHISRPFFQTLQYVRLYLDHKKWAERDVGIAPASLVPMTATPPPGVDESNVICLNDKDRENNGLNDRLQAEKHARLVSPVADVAKEAVEQAKRLVNGKTSAVGIIVNRVATAKEIFQVLQKAFPDWMVELVIGSMRPIDRDVQAKRLLPLVGPKRPAVSEVTSFIIATQCLEVGADYDFDALITECASLDALRQRFGRLNRGGRNIVADAVILMSNSALNPKKPDPIYKSAMPHTWRWLNEKSTPNGKVRTIDFGIDNFSAILAKNSDGRIPEELLSPSASLNAPVMLPAYLDFWCQTAPRPKPDPDVALFLHGPQGGEPDVQVCWRADLVESDALKKKHWCEVVSLLPPTSAECMSVPISRLRKWLAQEVGESGESDLQGVPETEGEADAKKNRKNKPAKILSTPCVIWRGARRSVLIDSPEDVQRIRPGDTVVLPVSGGGWENLGHIPSVVGTENPDQTFGMIDVAEGAFRKARDRGVLRLHPIFLPRFPLVETVAALFSRVADKENPPNNAELLELLEQASESIQDSAPELSERLRDFARKGILQSPYPDRRGTLLLTRKALGHATDWFLPPPPLDDGDDERSRTRSDKAITLKAHTGHVKEALERALSVLPVGTLADPFRLAVEFHDYGKADERFQAMLRRTDRTDSYLLSERTSDFLAKSDGVPRTKAEQDEARERAELPRGFRHEMLSVQLAERSDRVTKAGSERSMILHLIAAHHGHARPLAPVALDEAPPAIAVDGLSLDEEERKRNPSHRIDSGISERFWALTRQCGWWGIAFLEALLRLADQQASADEDAEQAGRATTSRGKNNG